jgi:hypothetical protein
MSRMCSSVVFNWAPYGTEGVYHDNCYDYAFDLNNPKSTNKNVPGDIKFRNRPPCVARATTKS